MTAQDNLKVFAIAGRTASGAGTGVDDVDQEELRLPVTALLTPGYLPNLLTQAANPNAFRPRQNTGTDMNLVVGSGTSKVDGYVLLGGVAGQGAYIVRLDATTKTIAVPATDVTNPARYGVYAYIDDTAYSGTASRAYANVACIRGTPAGSPATPGPLGTYSAYALLWEFQLPANATAVTNTILDTGSAIDQRTAARSVVGSNVVRNLSSSADQLAIGNSFTDITLSVVTIPTVSGRLYEVTSSLYFVTNNTTTFSYKLVAGGVDLAPHVFVGSTGPGLILPGGITGYFTGTGSSMVVKAQAQANPALAVDLKNSTRTGRFVIKDIGF